MLFISTTNSITAPSPSAASDLGKFPQPNLLAYPEDLAEHLCSFAKYDDRLLRSIEPNQLHAFL